MKNALVLCIIILLSTWLLFVFWAMCLLVVRAIKLLELNEPDHLFNLYILHSTFLLWDGRKVERRQSLNLNSCILFHKSRSCANEEITKEWKGIARPLDPRTLHSDQLRQRTCPSQMSLPHTENVERFHRISRNEMRLMRKPCASDSAADKKIFFLRYRCTCRSQGRRERVRVTGCERARDCHPKMRYASELHSRNNTAQQQLHIKRGEKIGLSIEIDI
jgi:hypothetical protein